MKDAVMNLWSSAYVIVFLLVLSAPCLALAHFGSLWSLASLLPTLGLGSVTGYGWTFKRGSKETWCGVGPIFGLLYPTCLAALLLNLSLGFHHPNAPFPRAAPNLFLLILSGLLILWTAYSLGAFLFHLWQKFR